MPYLDATSIAARIAAREVSAKSVVAAVPASIAEKNAALNCFTTVLAELAIAEAEAVDQAIAAGQNPGPLAGVPFGVKDLFDIAGVTTLAGSKINAERPPARRDATLVTRLKQAGASLVGAQNMDEYA